LTGDRTPLGFVPPSPLARQVPQSIAEGLQAESQRYKDELAQTKLLLEGKASLAQAQADATVAADRAVRDADARRDQAAALVASLEQAARATQAALDSKGTPKVSAARREEFIARARRASHEPLNEMQTRVEIDRQLGAAGWTVQDEGQLNLYAGTGVAVREVTLATGRADYLLYVNQRRRRLRGRADRDAGQADAWLLPAEPGLRVHLRAGGRRRGERRLRRVPDQLRRRDQSGRRLALDLDAAVTGLRK